MKKLYLIRHAKSSWKSDAPNDFERPLAKRGKREAPLMAKVLEAKGVFPDMILSSLAKRAKKTAKIFAERLGYPTSGISYRPEIYEAMADDLLRLIKSTDDRIDRLFLVGHNPGLTELANQLTPVHIDNLPTSGIFAVEFDVDSWSEITPHSGEMLFFEFPKKYLQE